MAHQPPPPPPPPSPSHGVLHAPWRDSYLRSLPALAAPEDTTATADPNSFLGRCWAEPEKDTENHVVVRTDGAGDPACAGLVMLNRYPYASGHMLVALSDARPRLLEYTPAQQAAFFGLLTTATAIVECALSPQGVNLGVNQGAAAGAGVPQHLHGHVVPRWHGDVNFSTAIGGVRVTPSSLESTADRCRRAWAQLRSETGG